MQIEARNQLVIDRLFLRRRQGQRCDLGLDGQEVEGDGGHHLHHDPLGLADLLLTAAGKVVCGSNRLQGGEVRVQPRCDSLGITGGASRRIIGMVTLADTLNGGFGLRLLRWPGPP